MKKLILASVSALALLGVAACSDTDDTTTQSVNPPADEQTLDTAPEAAPVDPAAPADETPPADTVEPVQPAPAQ